MTNKVTAPYNFVPLSDTVFKSPHKLDGLEALSHDKPLKGGFCGTIDFKIITETPLCVGGERKKAEGKNPGKVYMFKTPEGEKSYAIPGSSLRGMVKNVFEIATFSKFAPIEDSRFGFRDLSSAVSELYSDKLSQKEEDSGKIIFSPKANAGYLRPPQNGEEKWQITPCRFARIKKTHKDLKMYPKGIKDLYNNNKHLTRFKMVKKNKTEPIHGNQYYMFDEIEPDKNGDITGEVVFTGQISTKNKEFVFYNKAKKTLNVPEKVMQDFLAMQEPLKSKSDKDKTTWQYFEEELKADPNFRIPIFYLSKGSEVTHIGLSMMFPFPTPQTPHSLRDAQCENHSKEPTQFLDWTEAVFGFAAEEKGQGLKGRVDFALAKYQGHDKAEPQEAGILAQPKCSYYPAYLEQNMDDRGKILSKMPATYMEEDHKLSGWKRYPVHNSAGVQRIPEGLKNKKQLQTQLHTVPKCRTFHSKMRFHNLSKEELGGLLWALTFGGEDNNYCHSLGTGKPWGFGRVKIEIEEAAIIPNDMADNAPKWQDFITFFTEKMDEKLTDWSQSKQIKHLLAMANPNNEGANKQLKYMDLDQYTNSKKKPPHGLPRYKNNNS